MPYERDNTHGAAMWQQGLKPSNSKIRIEQAEEPETVRHRKVTASRRHHMQKKTTILTSSAMSRFKVCGTERGGRRGETNQWYKAHLQTQRVWGWEEKMGSDNPACSTPVQSEQNTTMPNSHILHTTTGERFNSPMQTYSSSTDLRDESMSSGKQLLHEAQASFSFLFDLVLSHTQTFSSNAHWLKTSRIPFGESKTKSTTWI